MWSAKLWLLVLPVGAVRKDISFVPTGQPSADVEQGDQQPAYADAGIGARIKTGPDVPIPGESNLTGLPLQWHIQNYVAMLRDRRLFEKYAMGNEHHHVAMFVDWPIEHPLFHHFKFLRGPPVNSTSVKEYIARYTLVMKIWILQVVRGLEDGRLGEQVEKWFMSNSRSNRAYLMALLQRMYVAFGHLCYRFAPNINRFAEVRYVTPRSCRKTYWSSTNNFFDLWLGRNFFTSAQHNLRLWTMEGGTRVGTLLHEVSHLVKEEAFVAYSSGAWLRDAPGRKCGDDGRLGTDDYAYGDKALDLPARDARHNADSVQFFIETSVLSEIDGGHAIEITVDGAVDEATDEDVEESTTVVTTSGERPKGGSTKPKGESTSTTTSSGPVTTATASTRAATTTRGRPTLSANDHGARQDPHCVLLSLSLAAMGATWA